MEYAGWEEVWPFVEQIEEVLVNSSFGDTEKLKKAEPMWQSFCEGMRTEPIRSGESLAVTESPRTAALCFDRILGGPEIPRGIAYHGGNMAESLCFFHDYSRFYNHTISYSIILDDAIDYFSSLDPKAKDIRRQQAAIWRRDIFFPQKLSARRDLYMRFISEYIHQYTRCKVVPLYESSVQCQKTYQEGDHSVIVAALTGLKIADEAGLKWEQVHEFRNDESAKISYRRLMYWLDSEMAGKSETYLVDAISLRINEYEKALKKHGIECKLGILESVLDPSLLTGAGVTAAAFVAGGFPEFGALLGGGVLLGRVAASVLRSRLALTDISTEHAEIAFFHEVKEKLGNSVTND